jgi:predicted RNA-binding Zn-ribbon protein involved in translation (DUF1610 family)
MPEKGLLPGFSPVHSDIIIGGSGGGQPLHLVILTVLVLLMAIVSVYDAAFGGSSNGVNLDKKIPFKCTSCDNIVMYTIRNLQKMQKPGQMGPMMGPMTLDCPKCRWKTLTQAVECPKCGEIFVMKMDPSRNMFDDKCPKCGESYAKAWQEKYRKTQGDQ